LLRLRSWSGIGLPVNRLARDRRAILLLFVAAATTEWPPTLGRGDFGNEKQRQPHRRQDEEKAANDKSD
jgi:hypothetical protein